MIARVRDNTICVCQCEKVCIKNQPYTVLQSYYIQVSVVITIALGCNYDVTLLAML